MSDIHHPKLDTNEEYDALFDQIWQEVDKETKCASLLAQFDSLSLEDFTEDEEDINTKELTDLLSSDD